MTPADTLIDALMNEARETAENIIQEAKQNAQDAIEEQRKKGRERAKDLIKSINDKAQDDASLIESREVSSAESKAKMLVQDKKNAIIDEIINQVKKKLQLWTKTENYIHFLENLIVQGGISISAPILEVVLNQKDSTLPLNMNKLAKQIGDKTGIQTTIMKSARFIDTLGGAIIRMPDEDLPKEFYESNPSLKLIPETNTLTKFKEVLKAFIEKQILPNIKDSFQLKVIEDLLNNFKKIDSLENRSGKIVINNTFEGMLNNRDREIRFEIAKILFK